MWNAQHCMCQMWHAILHPIPCILINQKRLRQIEKYRFVRMCVWASHCEGNVKIHTWEFGFAAMISFSWRINRITTMCCVLVKNCALCFAYDNADPAGIASRRLWRQDIWAITCDVTYIHGEFKNKNDKSWGEQGKKIEHDQRRRRRIWKENGECWEDAAMKYQTRVTDFNFQSFNHCASEVMWSEVCAYKFQWANTTVTFCSSFFLRGSHIFTVQRMYGGRVRCLYVCACLCSTDTQTQKQSNAHLVALSSLGRSSSFIHKNPTRTKTEV